MTHTHQFQIIEMLGIFFYALSGLIQ